jgi:hypothetical protein
LMIIILISNNVITDVDVDDDNDNDDDDVADDFSSSG